MAQAEKGIHRTEKSDPVWNWKFRLLEAEVFLWQGRPRDALALINTPPGEITGELFLRTRLAQGRALYSIDQRDAAEAVLTEAQQLAGKSYPELMGEVILARGTSKYNAGAFGAAKSDFDGAVKLARDYHQPLLEAKATGSLSRLLTHDQFYDAAMDWGLRSLDLSIAHQAHHIEAATRLNVGWCYLELGNLDQATKEFEAAENFAAGADMKQIQHRVLNSLGRVYYDEGRYGQARDKFRKAYEIAMQIGDEDSGAVYLNNLSLTSLILGNRGEAREFNLKALEIEQKNHSRADELWTLVNKAEIEIANGDLDSARFQLQTVLDEKGISLPLQWEAEAVLADLFKKSGQTSRVRRQYREVLNVLAEARRSIRYVENRLSFATREASFYSDYIGFLADHHDNLEALRVSEFMRARTLEEGLHAKKGNAPPIQLAEIQTFLRKRHQVILAYWLGAERSFLWAVTPSQIELFRLPPRSTIDKMVVAFQKAVNELDDVEQGNENGQALYHILVEPAAGLIPKGTRVAIIADGSLGKINFETLLAPGKSSESPAFHYWIRDVEVENPLSIALLVRPRAARPVSRKLLLIGDPIKATDDYPPLTHAGKEMDAISGLFHASEYAVFRGKDAVPSVYFDSHPDLAEIVDFVTHGFASDTQPLESAIILSPEPGAASQVEKTFKLYARDIIRKPINAKLVVISACQGAGKRSYSGEGLVGLAWAFLRAGAHQVIAGLWDVDDDITPELMKNLYTEWLKSKDPAKALRTAKLRIINSGTGYRRPYYWGSLQLYTGS